MATPRLSSRGKARRFAGLGAPCNRSADGLVIKVVKMGCRSAAGLIVEESALARGCEPPAPQVLFPTGPRPQKPGATETASTPTRETFRSRDSREFIPDSSNWKKHNSYREAFDRLIADLKSSDAKIK